MIRKLLVIFLLGMLAACAETQYSYTPPQTPEGKNCVAQCQATQSSCRSSEHERSSAAYQNCEAAAEQDKKNCEMQSLTDQNTCLRYARTEMEKMMCSKKSCYKNYCSNTANYEFCDKEFKVCYQNCGGTISIMK